MHIVDGRQAWTLSDAHGRHIKALEAVYPIVKAIQATPAHFTALHQLGDVCNTDTYRVLRARSMGYVLCSLASNPDRTRGKH